MFKLKNYKTTYLPVQFVQNVSIISVWVWLGDEMKRNKIKIIRLIRNNRSWWNDLRK